MCPGFSQILLFAWIPGGFRLEFSYEHMMGKVWANAVDSICQNHTPSSRLGRLRIMYSVSHSLKKGQGAGQKKGTFDA